MLPADIPKRKGLFLLCMFLLFVAFLGIPKLSVAQGKAGIQSPEQEKMAQWKKMSQADREYFRTLYRKYSFLSKKEQDLLEKKLQQFKELPLKVQKIILKNSRLLSTLSEEDRQSFYRLIKKYRNLPPAGKKQVHKAFRKIKKLPKAKQLQLFHLLLAENRKTGPRIKKVIRDFLVSVRNGQSEDRSSPHK